MLMPLNAFAIHSQDQVAHTALVLPIAPPTG